MLWALGALVALGSGCGGAAPQPAPAPATPDDASASTAGATTSPLADAGAIYEQLSPCPAPPTPIAHDPVEGLVIPPGTVVTDVQAVGPITSVSGFVELTPLEIRDLYADDPEVELLYIEDEGFEAEILVEREGVRTFIKATIRCRTGSAVAGIVSSDPASLPRPGQQAGAAATAPEPAAS